jgi:hypothetical protein
VKRTGFILLALATCSKEPPPPAPLPDAPEHEAILAEHWERFEQFYDPELVEQFRGAFADGEAAAARGRRDPALRELARRYREVGVGTDGLRDWLGAEPPAAAEGWCLALGYDRGPEEAGALAVGLALSNKPDAAISALSKAHAFEALMATLAYLGKVLTLTQLEMIAPPAYRTLEPVKVLEQMLGAPPTRERLAEAGLRLLSDRVFLDSFLEMEPVLRSRGAAGIFVAARNRTYPHVHDLITQANAAAPRDEALRAKIRALADAADTFDERLPLMRAELSLLSPEDPRVDEIYAAHVAFALLTPYDPVMAAWVRAFFGATPDAKVPPAEPWLSAQPLDPAVARRVEAMTRDEALRFAAELFEIDASAVEPYLIRRRILR